MDWISKAAELKFDKGISWTKLQQALLEETGEDIPFNKIRDTLRRHPRYNANQTDTSNISEEILKAIEKQQTVKGLCDKFNISSRILKATIEDLKEEGYQITEYGDSIKLCRDIVPEENVFRLNWKGEKIFRFGSTSDSHLGSKWQQLTYLNEFYDICQSEGIKTVYHSGDITEGVKMRPGHEHDVFLHGSDDQEEYVIANYPKRNGTTTEFITGNHDHSSIKHSGHDIGKRIAEKRKDMKYLGLSNAKVYLTPNCIIELNHPLDGASYALSYAIQKSIDSMTGGEKPNIFLNGHHHKSMYLPVYRNVHAFECGTFEAQTPWMRGKRIAANVGGWIIEIHVDEEGTITRCKGEFIPFYKMIEKDY